jgi:HK97 family phage prohead protease
MIKLIADTLITVDAAAGEIPRRTISGVAVEYGKTATVSDGTRVKFLPGSLSASGKNPKLYMQHDSSQIIGQVVERLDTKEAMLFVAKISATRQGDEALILASDGTIDSVSVGVSVKDFRYEDDIMVIEAATWQELSLVSQPAFEGSIITQVAASIPQTEPEISTIEPEPTQETQPMSEVTPVEAVEATIPTAPIFASAKREPRLPAAGEFIAAMHKGGEVAASAQRVFADYRAFHKSPIEAAAGDQVLSDVGGIVPVPNFGTGFCGYQLYCSSAKCTRYTRDAKQWCRCNIHQANVDNSPNSCTTVCRV